MGETVLLGVVSGPGNFSLNCKGAGVYGRVAHPHILNWIKNNIKDHDIISWIDSDTLIFNPDKKIEWIVDNTTQYKEFLF
mgnify:CR=1 FL=1